MSGEENGKIPLLSEINSKSGDLSASQLSTSSNLSASQLSISENLGSKTFHVLFHSGFESSEKSKKEDKISPSELKVKRFGIESGLEYTDKNGIQHMIKPVDNGVMGLYFTDSEHMHKWTRKRYFKLESMKNIYSESPEKGAEQYFDWAKEYLIKMKDKEVEKLPEYFKKELKTLRDKKSKPEDTSDEKWRIFLKDVMEFSEKSEATPELKKIKALSSNIESRLVHKQYGALKGLRVRIRSYVEAKARQAFKGKKRSTLNESVVLEYLSTEILRAKGFATHEMSLVTQQSRDSNQKVFALDVKFLGDKDNPFKTLEQGSSDSFIMDGCLVKKDGAGYRAVPGDVKDLATSEIAFRMLDDYDAFGSKGANKGVIGGQLQIIDTGNSFSGKGKPLRDNFTVEGSDPLKNFSLYSDLPHSHRMAGVILEAKMRGQELPGWLNELSETNNSLILSEKDLAFWLDVKKQADKITPGQDLDHFQTMIDFLEKQGNPDQGKTDKSMLKIKKEVEKQKDEYLERSKALCKTFEEKLKLTPIEIDFLHRVEIACSEHIKEKKTSDGKIIKFDPPHITKHVPFTWKKNSDTGAFTISFDNPKDSAKLEAFNKKLSEMGITAEKEGKSLKINKDNVKGFSPVSVELASAPAPAVTSAFKKTRDTQSSQSSSTSKHTTEKLTPSPGGRNRSSPM